jgi:hypothetical protein
VGWAILILFGLLDVSTGEAENCTANRGQAYQNCVRSSDLTGVWVQALVIGLAMAGVTLVVRGGRRQRGEEPSDPMLWKAVIVSGALTVACLLLWVVGLRGGWAPDRPFPYEPLAPSQANTMMMAGMFIGVLAGALFPLGRRFVSQKG